MKKCLILVALSTIFSSPVLAADEVIPEGTQLVKRAASLPWSPAGNKVFTGNVSVKNLSGTLPGMPANEGMVRFEKGSRSFWHTHPVGQVLIILEGEGRSGVYGQKVSKLKSGDVVVCPKGVKHFHGGAPDSHMIQMTITAQDEKGGRVNWLEPVTDEQYLNTEK